MFDNVINYIDKFAPEILVIQFGFLVILSTLFLWLWFSNRRKYNNLKHAIPANVVKSYLDSIIQNSTALKSSLFRGGGQDLGSVPSVMPLHQLMGGDGLALSGAPSTALLEELNQKKAHIASLESQLSALQGSGRELEAKFTRSQQALTDAEKKIKELEALLAKLKDSGQGSDAALQAELEMVTRERDELKDRLREFEIIADDLANLKRLQQENEQLKRSLKAQSGSADAVLDEEPIEKIKTKPSPGADVSDLLSDMGQPTSENENHQALEDFLSPAAEDNESPVAEADSEDLLEQMAAESDETESNDPVENKPKSEKTPEDLLSEFEKMLG